METGRYSIYHSLKKEIGVLIFGNFKTKKKINKKKWLPVVQLRKQCGDWREKVEARFL